MHGLVGGRFYGAGVKQVVKVRLLPSEVEARALEKTLRACNEAASWLSAQMHTVGVFRKIDAQHRFYTELRQRFGLGAQAAIRVIGKVSAAYASRRGNIAAGNYGPPGSNRRLKIERSPISFRALAAQPFDMHCLSWRFPDGPNHGRRATVSIWTVAGRLKELPIAGDPKRLMLLQPAESPSPISSMSITSGSFMPRLMRPKLR
jgi:putative transposase